MRAGSGRLTLLFLLEDWEATDLPLERQRRVALAARGAIDRGGGDEVRMRIVNVHLDHRSRWRRSYRSFGRGRADQAEWLVRQYGDEETVLLGGDLNTWFRGRGESAVRILRQAFPQPENPPGDGTVIGPGVLPDLVLDHLFFRLPEGVRASYQVISDRYRSDHRPVLGRITIDSSGTGDPGFEGNPLCFSARPLDLPRLTENSGADTILP